MKWILRSIFVCAVLILLIGLFVIFYGPDLQTIQLHDHAVVEHELKSTNGGEGVVYAIVVDTDHNGKADHLSVKNGDDSFLVIKASAKTIQETTEVGDDGFYLFNGTSSLSQHDKNDDGAINAADPVFNELELVTFKRHHEDLIITNLKQAGIQAIFISPAFLIAVKEGRISEFDQEIGHVVMADSSKRVLKVVALPLAFFK